jgi:hypothetical protein
VIGNIAEDEQIFAAACIFDHGTAFTGFISFQIDLDPVVVFIIVFECGRSAFHDLIQIVIPESGNEGVDFFAQLLSRRKDDQSQRGYGKRAVQLLMKF